MEIIIAIVLILAVLVVFVTTKSSGSIPPSNKIDEPQWSPPKTVAQPPSFDAQSAKSEVQQLQVQGPARVIDGDTIVIKKTQIRLFGIDAPEINHPYGQKAKWALVGLCKGQVVRSVITETDAHGRSVGKCFLPDGRDLSAEMVKLGLAIDWPKFSGGAYKTLEIPGVRKKLWLADARQKGNVHVWEKFEERRNAQTQSQDQD